ncbi:putative histone-lysine N-methyltransferase PRDM6 [Nematostella vectensis]|uniref:putative histone-lysine N-methyltransferase PRDM6 n=1 Tax=Nematostella vectensis TaxID=45351 RepID=UPI002076E3B2|nr:putative histone-lysine N-methyltransferase PRDM6 [Nematostella vectensis]XP_048583780.1 putative histone-lysine N-methyltransferase PRDM6 [Nematostella vectensis]XP_048583781.1 putative histone-lysine N-methyltransferase PRDM6 [Nematostella vectensis]XP_048583782.1 putative histone-lysine N-methyltransferase PRDM6 [Nematostella vectensis]
MESFIEDKVAFTPSQVMSCLYGQTPVRGVELMLTQQLDHHPKSSEIKEVSINDRRLSSAQYTSILPSPPLSPQKTHAGDFGCKTLSSSFERDNNQLVLLSACTQSTNQEQRTDKLCSRAFTSFPPGLQLCTSSLPGHVFGVRATTGIPAGFIMGPYEGNKVKPADVNTTADSSYMWEIFENGVLSFFVDASDEFTSNWMRFVRSARNSTEQNLSAIQFQQAVYYRTLRRIVPGEELLVWYDKSYPQYLGIPLASIHGLQRSVSTSEMDLRKAAKQGQGSNTETESRGCVHQHALLVRNRSLDSQFRITSFDMSRYPSETRTDVVVPPEFLQKHCSYRGVSDSSTKHFVNDIVSFERPEKQEVSLGNRIEIRTRTASECSGNVSTTSDENPSPFEDDEELAKIAEGRESIRKETPNTSPTEEVTSWKCAQCEKIFPQKMTLQMHKCPKLAKRPYQCGHCTAAFANPSNLRSHVVSHVNEKPFKCGFCSRAFAGATTLNNHIRMHTGQKPYSCQKCGVTFTQAACHARHVRNSRESGECSPVKAVPLELLDRGITEEGHFD